MADTSLQTRIADFLKNHPPFIHLSEEDLFFLSGEVIVSYAEKDEFVYQTRQEPSGRLYVIRQGAVQKVLVTEGTSHVVDIADVGDVFGVASHISGKPYKTSAQCMEDTMLYAIPWESFQPYMEKYPRVALFFAAGYAQNVPHVRFNLDEVTEEETGFINTTSSHSLFREDDVIPISTERPIVSCGSTTTILEAAQLLTRENVGSTIVVDEQKRPLGIVTDVDFRQKVVAGQESLDQPVTSVMSSPVMTIPEGKTAGEIILLMTTNKIRHLCVTRDGTPGTEAIAVISEHDVLLLHGNNPAIIVKEIMNNRDQHRLPTIRKRADLLAGQYLRQGASSSFVASILGGINDSLHVKAVEFAMGILASEGMELPQVKFCWVTLGSQGRREQMLKTDQDNALIFEDGDGQGRDSINYYFVRLGREINRILNGCGFFYCPSNMMGGNSQWCQPLSAWKKYFTQWIQVPEEKALMNGTIFFDFRPVYGHRELAEELWDHIHQVIARERSFINFLAANALKNPPPLSFFKNIILEKSGEHRNKFDLKLRGTMPLADAARVLALDLGTAHVTSTMDRFRAVAEREPQLADICSFGIDSYELFLRFRTLNGLRNGDTGRYLNPTMLKKIEKNALKNAFRTIEILQDTLRVRYQLDYMR